MDDLFLSSVLHVSLLGLLRKSAHFRDQRSAAIFAVIILTKNQMTAGIAGQKASTQAMRVANASVIYLAKTIVPPTVSASFVDIW